jgi:hypothetical protein
MAGLEPFTPDDEYCVYCHAPAAGMCAECGALCCADCVDVVMGWTARRAVCRNCAATVAAPTSSVGPAAWLIGLVAGAAVTIYLLAFAL